MAELQETFLLSMSFSPVYFFALRAPLTEKQNFTLYTATKPLSYSFQ